MTDFIDLRKLDKDALFKLRKQVVSLKGKGYSGGEIEHLLRIRSNRVSEIWRKYQKCGKEGLKPGVPGRKQGEKALLNEPRQEEIRRMMIENTPDELKMPFSLWTCQVAIDCIKRKYYIRMPVRSMTNYFKKWGFICKAPIRSDEYRKNKAFICFMEEDFPGIVRRAKSENVGIYWFCENRIDDTSIFAAVTARGTARFSFFSGRITQEKFIFLMSQLIRYADRKVFFIAADTACFRGKKVRTWLKNNRKSIEVFYHPARTK